MVHRHRQRASATADAKGARFAVVQPRTQQRDDKLRRPQLRRMRTRLAWAPGPNPFTPLHRVPSFSSGVAGARCPLRTQRVKQVGRSPSLHNQTPFSSYPLPPRGSVLPHRPHFGPTSPGAGYRPGLSASRVSALAASHAGSGARGRRCCDGSSPRAHLRWPRRVCEGGAYGVHGFGDAFPKIRTDFAIRLVRIGSEQDFERDCRFTQRPFHLGDTCAEGAV